MALKASEGTTTAGRWKRGESDGTSEGPSDVLTPEHYGQKVQTNVCQRQKIRAGDTEGTHEVSDTAKFGNNEGASEGINDGRSDGLSMEPAASPTVPVKVHPMVLTGTPTEARR
jgi:hypothetical protein